MDATSLNSKVLQRRDSKLSKILLTSPICNVYKYNFSDNDWDRLDVQGPLFVYTRQNNDGDYPYAAFVMNRLGLEDFYIGLCPKSWSVKHEKAPMRVTLDDPLLMIEECAETTYGLWLFDENDRVKCLKLLEDCLESKVKIEKKRTKRKNKNGLPNANLQVESNQTNVTFTLNEILS